MENANNFLDRTKTQNLTEFTPKKYNFTYSYKLDENGALYYLGTGGRQDPYKNPYTIGKLHVIFSSVSTSTDIKHFVGRELENCRT